MDALIVIVGYIAGFAWTYLVYQVGYHNASKDAEEIAGRQLWVRQEQETRRRYSNVPPWEE